jgi:hypothetical protein
LDATVRNDIVRAAGPGSQVRDEDVMDTLKAICGHHRRHLLKNGSTMRVMRAQGDQGIRSGDVEPV